MRVGIIGAGFMGTTHAAAWAETAATLVGVADSDADAAAGLATRYHARGYPSLQAILAEVDVVDICTPTHLHYEMVLAAAAAGRQVICEKPLARTVAQGQAMIAACRQAGVRLLIAHVVRFFPEYALARSLVVAGQIGRPAVLRLARGGHRPQKAVGNWFLDVEKSGGLLLDLMIHDFDYARWVAGEVETVFARSIGHSRPGAPVDYGLAILRHRGGALSHVAAAWAYPPPTFRTGLEIAGDGGLIEFESAAMAPIELLLRPDGAGSTPDVGKPSSPVHESPYTTEIKEFYAALAHGHPVRVTAEDGLAALQIALAAAESAHTGQAVRLAPLPEVQP
ncbi:MAG TPA: Gfo/Idh/MocA family oxidoreductase [Chloroflexia bacterium]|nr:Gfo/Idh/MocA family oxidoreductase [Chloroflexia bacterium]